MSKKVWWIVGGLVVVVAAVQEFGGVKPMKSTPLKYSPTITEMAVKSVLRDPDSAKFGPMSGYDDRKFAGKPVTAVCGVVNAKNGFGGFTGDKNFVYVTDPPMVVIDNDTDNALFVKMWNSLCAGKHTSNRTVSDVDRPSMG